MSIHIVGFRPADGKWREMKTVWEACEKAEIEIPQEVLEFFDHEDPTNKLGMEILLEDAISDHNEEAQNGYQIDIEKLPKGVRYIRVSNSW